MKPKSRWIAGLGRASALVAALASVGAPTLAQAQPKCPGADQRKPGHVWRDAFVGDHLCVTAEARTQAATDNAQASQRRVAGGAYGPNTCAAGYVWRAAGPKDQVCIVGA